MNKIRYIPCNEIHYTTRNGEPLGINPNFYNTYNYDIYKSIISHSYKNGVGVIRYNKTLFEFWPVLLPCTSEEERMLKEVILPRSIVRIPEIGGFYEVEEDCCLYFQSPEPPEIEPDDDYICTIPLLCNWPTNIYVPQESYEKYLNNNAWTDGIINLKAYRYR